MFAELKKFACMNGGFEKYIAFVTDGVKSMMRQILNSSDCYVQMGLKLITRIT